jgi:hypothetical protein
VEMVYSFSGGSLTVSFSNDGSFRTADANVLHSASVLNTSAFSMSCACGRESEINMMMAAYMRFLLLDHGQDTHSI